MSDVFRLQVQVAALQEAVLACRAVEQRVADVCRPARLSRCSPRVASRIARLRAARVARCVEQVEALCREQLDDVGRTDRTLVAATQADVGDRRPLEAKLVRVGLDAVAVVRIPVGGIERQALRERLVLSDRDAGFHEELVDLRRAA